MAFSALSSTRGKPTGSQMLKGSLFSGSEQRAVRSPACWRRRLLSFRGEGQDVFAILREIARTGREDAER